MEELIEQKNWLGRNWKWAVPTFGCLPIIITIVLLFTAMVSEVTSMFKDSVPYSVGMENLMKNELVIEKLGEPIEANGMFQGSINYENGNGTADLKIPVKGPNGEADLLVIAEKKSDVWTYQTMKVIFNETEVALDLLPNLKE